ncbi:hypothetical protein M0812_13213 [Anaeramoeba flamelloides]|uniref:COP9 signalosome complex subunit 8 n=1 Tax=Anaeramoeba flamelloides TaxID=1746091 RepID=A0AAV7ZGS1_9EUKA|nr:hypothetical protein M0812_13213 [Anaeramoeba flamelloides]
MSKVLNEISKHLKNKDFEKLLHLLEEIEMKSHMIEDERPVQPLYLEQMICYVLTNRLTEARFFYKRLPKQQKKNKHLSAMWKILQLLWNKENGGNLQVIPSVKKHHWPEQSRIYIDSMIESFRNRIVALIGRAYSSVSMSTVALLLGFSEEDTTDIVIQYGWKVDQKTVYPKTLLEKQKTVDVDQLQQLTEYVVALEKN